MTSDMYYMNRKGWSQSTLARYARLSQSNVCKMINGNYERTKIESFVSLCLALQLGTIARQGRAFGIHMILATQRPDANILSGQIKNTINHRIRGRADNILSQIILDNTDAADQIPKTARGRFILHDKTVFQANWFDDTGGI